VAPSAAKVICVDLDATIIPLKDSRPPFPGVVEALKALREDDWEIIILTSRFSPTWWAAEARTRHVNARAFGTDQMNFVYDLLYRYKVPFDRVTCEKVPAAAYFDDKAIKVTEEYPLATALTDFRERHR
jgi:hypothetical protein